MKRIATVGAMIVLVLSLVACSGSTVPDITGMSYSDAYDALENAGFDPHRKATYVYEDGSEAELSDIAKDGVVVSQSVNAGDSMPSDGMTVTVKSTYKDLKDALLAGQGQPVANTYQKVIDAGYTPTYLENTSQADITTVVVSDVTGQTGKDAVNWVLTGVEEPDTDNKTVRMLVQSDEQYKNAQAQQQIINTLQSKLPVNQAWAYVDQAMQQKCPYGYSLHDVAGVITQSAVDENTWHLSCYCDVRNAYGQTAKNCTCDAYVTAKSNGTVSVSGLTIS